MAMSLGAMCRWIRAEIPNRRPVAEAMADLITQCEVAHPHPDWAKLRPLPYGDVEDLEVWLNFLFEEQPPDFPLKGLWFGLCNPVRGKGNAVADLRVSGAKAYDPTDCEWAVNAPWQPGACYAESDVLADIYRIAYRRGASEEERKGRLGNNAEYPLCLGYAAFALREVFADSLSPEPILGESDSVGVMVGFDSGDFLHVGTLTESGFDTEGEAGT
jgi:hypothetical protein